VLASARRDADAARRFFLRRAKFSVKAVSWCFAAMVRLLNGIR
jgi:hypothetical protein